MTFLSSLTAMLAMRTRALRRLSERQELIPALMLFCAGFLSFAVIRSRVYASLPDFAYQQLGPMQYFLSLNLLQALAFLLLVYVPVLIVSSNAVSDGSGFSILKTEYRAHISVLLPLWGMLFLIDTPLQILFPQFLVIGFVGISIAMLVLLVLMATYTVWAISQLNFLTIPQAVGVFALSWFTLPVYAVLTSFLVALPVFVLIALSYFGYQSLRTHFESRENERTFQKSLHALTVNPQDADAHYQLGLVSLKKQKPEMAQTHLRNAIGIVPDEPEYHYYLGRACESNEQWPDALSEYEAAYRLYPEFGRGDILRALGKAYLHTGNVERSIEFLNLFITRRNSDPEGRYWLARALEKSGDLDQMRFQLSTILEQSRTSPRFFRKENREWIYRARNLLRVSRPSPV